MQKYKRVYKGKQAKKTEEVKVNMLKALVSTGNYNAAEKVTFVLLEVAKILDNESYHSKKD